MRNVSTEEDSQSMKIIQSNIKELSLFQLAPWPHLQHRRILKVVLDCSEVELPIFTTKFYYLLANSNYDQLKNISGYWTAVLDPKDTKEGKADLFALEGFYDAPALNLDTNSNQPKEKMRKEVRYRLSTHFNSYDTGNLYFSLNPLFPFPLKDFFSKPGCYIETLLLGATNYEKRNDWFSFLHTTAQPSGWWYMQLKEQIHEERKTSSGYEISLEATLLKNHELIKQKTIFERLPFLEQCTECLPSDCSRELREKVNKLGQLAC